MIYKKGCEMKFSLQIPLIFMIFISGYALSKDGKIEINAAEVNAQCLSNKWQKKDLLKLKKDKFILKNTAEKEALALQLLHCLANPDPEIRDGIAFEALSHWLREGQLNQSIYIDMFNYLTRVIESKVNDPFGVYQSFSMLVLSEVARVDRKSPFLIDEQRARLVSVGSQYLTHLKDYRGFSKKVGWRHGIAHSSDLMLQVALNPAISKHQLDTILEALASQVNAYGQHAYTQGESKRMAMAVLYVFLRSEHSVVNWNNWLAKLTEPSPFKKWQEVYQSEAGLIKLHNTQSFLYALYATIKPSKNEKLVQMVPALEMAIKEVN
jgi:hypothetical protein